MKRILMAGVCLAFLAACNRSLISGTVANIKGEALPGVAVQVEGTHYQALTDGLGQYRLPYVSGAVVLQFMKTGYTPGTLVVPAGPVRSITAETVSLWELPLDKGVYLYEDFRYREATKIVPESFLSKDKHAAYATRRWPDLDTTDTEPLVLCYKMPDWDVRLCRMDLTERYVQLPGGGLEEAQVLAPTRELPVQLVPIDQPEGLLRQVELPGPLEPGTYAVHWGALDGEVDKDPRIFAFSVVDFTLALPPKEEAARQKAEEAFEDSEPEPSAPSSGESDEDIPDVD
ncbi:MAG: carboxypeptidase-like regulatory domain-containing protein [Candidatus Hydrogenedentales bacterium]|jgi:hypothetical protein